MEGLGQVPGSHPRQQTELPSSWYHQQIARGCSHPGISLHTSHPEESAASCCQGQGLPYDCQGGAHLYVQCMMGTRVPTMQITKKKIEACQSNALRKITGVLWFVCDTIQASIHWRLGEWYSGQTVQEGWGVVICLLASCSRGLHIVDLARREGARSSPHL